MCVNELLADFAGGFIPGLRNFYVDFDIDLSSFFLDPQRAATICVTLFLGDDASGIVATWFVENDLCLSGF